MMWYGESAALIAIKVKSIMIDFIIKLLCIYISRLCCEFERDDTVTALHTHFLPFIMNKYRAYINLACTSYFPVNNFYWWTSLAVRTRNQTDLCLSDTYHEKTSVGCVLAGGMCLPGDITDSAEITKY